MKMKNEKSHLNLHHNIQMTETVKTCIAILKSGKRKGKVCGTKIHKKSVSGNYCGIHISEENPKVIHPVKREKIHQDELIQIQRQEGETPRKLKFITSSLVLFFIVMLRRKKQNGNKKKDPLFVKKSKINGYEHLLISPIVKLNGSPWVWNSKTKNWLNPYKVKTGYWILSGYLPKTKTKTFRVNRILALTFIHNPDPEHNTMVHHKNNKRWDNRLENLEWVTPQKNSEEKIQSKTHRIPSSEETTPFEGFPIPLSFMKKETYVNPPDDDRYTGYLASRDGRVRNIKTKLFQNPKPSADGYVQLCLTIERKEYHPILSDILARMFKENPDKKKYTVVDHIDRNPLNNDLSNLKWSTVSENNRNKNKTKNKTSDGYGVCFLKTQERWVSYVTLQDGTQRIIGRYKTEEIAKRSHDQEAYKLFGKDTNLNYPDEIEQTMKMIIPKKKKSDYRYKGYTKKTDGRLISQIAVNNVKYYIGTFDNEEDAARAYDRKAIEMLGIEDAKKRGLNFPV
jgi:HNH endonuclease